MEAAAPEVSSCSDGSHKYPDPDFEVGARVCDICGHKEY